MVVMIKEIEWRNENIENNCSFFLPKRNKLLINQSLLSELTK